MREKSLSDDVKVGKTSFMKVSCPTCVREISLPSSIFQLSVSAALRFTIRDPISTTIERDFQQDVIPSERLSILTPRGGKFMKSLPFSGVNTAVVSPFFENSTLDLEAFSRLIASQKDSGIHGVVVAGTTGESPTLSLDEKKTLVEHALAQQDSQFSVYVGTGTNATSSTIETTRALTEISVRGERPRGAMIVAPYYNKPNQNGMLLHFSEVARAFPSLALCLYNVPGRTASEIHPSTLASVAKHYSNIVCIKEAAGQPTAMTAIRLALAQNDVTRDFLVLSGDDASFPASLVMGAEGIISVVSHVIPKTMVDMLSAAEKSDLAELKRLNMAAFPLSRDLFCAPNPVPVKYALSLSGQCRPTVRSPLAELSKEEKLLVERALMLSKEQGAQLI